jgi:hypothetical protein
MNEINPEAARQAALLLGVGPDPREPGFWNTYLTVDAKALAQLLDALDIPMRAVYSTSTSESATDDPLQEAHP